MLTEIIRSKDCGNSPKNQLIENLTVALMTGDLRTVTDLVTDDIQWNVVGGDTILGKAMVLKKVEKMKSISIIKLTVAHVISHGKSGAVNGMIEFQSATNSFCNVFDFANAKGTKVREITSYQIDI